MQYKKLLNNQFLIQFNSICSFSCWLIFKTLYRIVEVRLWQWIDDPPWKSADIIIIRSMASFFDGEDVSLIKPSF